MSQANSPDSEKTLVPVTRVTATILTANLKASALGEFVLAAVAPDTMQQTLEALT